MSRRDEVEDGMVFSGLAPSPAERRLDHEIAQAVAAERERCARIAEDRAVSDQSLYGHETDWRQPYACNRVVRASMDIAAAIRKQST